jgi:polyisoprenoid-binding protein YceI
MTARTLSILRTHDDREIPVAGVYHIDPMHTTVEFVGRHLMITKVRGRFTKVSGTITIADEPGESHVEVDIDAASLDSGVADRDAHMRSPDFFDVDKYPTITFKSTKVEADKSSTWAVAGDLTVRGVTRPITLQVEFDGASASPMGDERIAFSAATDIDREGLGLTWNIALETGGVLVGKKSASNSTSKPSPKRDRKRQGP